MFTEFSCQNKETGEVRVWSSNDLDLIKSTLYEYCIAIGQFAMLSEYVSIKRTVSMLKDLSACKDMTSLEDYAKKYSLELQLEVFKWVCRHKGNLTVKVCFQAYIISLFWRENIYFYIKETQNGRVGSATVLREMITSFIDINNFEHTGYRAVCNTIIAVALHMVKVRVGMASIFKSILSSYRDNNPYVEVDIENREWFDSEGNHFTFEDFLFSGLDSLGVQSETAFYLFFEELAAGLDMYDNCSSAVRDIKLSAENREIIEEQKSIISEAIKDVLYASPIVAGGVLDNLRTFYKVVETVISIDSNM